MYTYLTLPCCILIPTWHHRRHKGCSYMHNWDYGCSSTGGELMIIVKLRVSCVRACVFVCASRWCIVLLYCTLKLHCIIWGSVPWGCSIFLSHTVWNRMDSICKNVVCTYNLWIGNVCMHGWKAVIVPGFVHHAVSALSLSKRVHLYSLQL